MSVVANLVVRVSAATTDFEKDLKGLQGKWNRIGGQFQAVGAQLTKGLTIPIAAVGGLAVKAAVEFESSFAGIRKTVNGSQADFAKLAQDMRDMAKIKPVDVNSLNRIGEIGGQLGISSDGIRDFTDVVSDMTIATDLSADEAAFSLARIAKLTETPKEGFRALGDIIAKLGDAGASTEGEIVAFGERLAGVGHLAGFSSLSILATGAAMANLGIEADAGGTAVQKVWIDMLQAVQSGGKQLDKYGAVIGKTGSQFAELFNMSPDQAFLQFVQGLEQSGKGSVNILQGLGIDDARQIRAFAGLAASAGTLKEAYDNAGLAQGKLKSEVAIFADTAASKFILFKNAIYDVAITLGTALLPHLLKLKPAIEGAIGIVATMVEWFANLPQPVQTAAIAIAGIGAALGPIAYGFGAIAKAGAGLAGLLRLTGVAGVIGKIGGAISEIVQVASTFGFEGLTVWISEWGVFGQIILGAGRAFTLLTGPVGIVIAVITTLLIAVKELTGSWTTAFTIILPPVGLLMQAWQALTANFEASKATFDQIWRILGDLVTIVSQNFTQAITDVKALWASFIGLFSLDEAKSQLTEIGTTIRDSIGGALQWVANQAGLDQIFSWTEAKRQFFELGAVIKQAFGEAIDWAYNKLKWLLDKIPGLNEIEAVTAAAAGRRPDVRGDKPKPALNATLGPAMDLNEAMALLDRQTVKTANSFAGLGKTGADAMKGIKKEADKVLESTRAVVNNQAAGDYPSVYSGVQLGADTSGLGGLMKQFMDLASGSRLQNIANEAGMSGAPSVSSINVTEQVAELAFDQIAKHAEASAKAAESFAQSIERLGASMSGGMGVAIGLAGQFVRTAGQGGFGKGMQGFFGGENGWGEKAGSFLDIGLGGYGIGKAAGGKWKGAAAGGVHGAIAGSKFGPWGTAIGFGIGFVGGLFGGAKAEKEQRKEMDAQRKDLAERLGGMDQLRKYAEMAGVSVDLLFSTTKAKEFDAQMQKVTDAIKVLQERIATTVSDIDKVMAEGGLIGKDLWQNILKDKDAEEIKAKFAEVFSASVERSAEGFNKIAVNFELLKAPLSELGVLADAAFAGLIAGGASIPEAIAAMGDGLAHIQEVLAKTGQTPTGPLADILNYQKIVQANTGLFELLSGVTDMLTGLGNSGLLTQTRFAALGATITQAFGQLQAQGVAGATAIELLQPGLQRLWEAQQLFGLHTDAATQSLINQAVQQGVVGEKMKDVNHQILDVLTAIATALGADIPAAAMAMTAQVLPEMDKMANAGATTAGKITNDLGPYTGCWGSAVDGALIAAAGVNTALDTISPKFQALKDQATGVFSGIPHTIDIDMKVHGSLPPGVGSSTLGTGSHSPTSNDWIPHMASGGIVSRPTLSLIGEDGPEAVVPLDDYNGAGGTINITVNGTADAAFAKTLARAINRGGDVRTAWEVALR